MPNAPPRREPPQQPHFFIYVGIDNSPPRQPPNSVTPGRTSGSRAQQPGQTSSGQDGTQPRPYFEVGPDGRLLTMNPNRVSSGALQRTQQSGRTGRQTESTQGGTPGNNYVSPHGQGLARNSGSVVLSSTAAQSSVRTDQRRSGSARSQTSHLRERLTPARQPEIHDNEERRNAHGQIIGSDGRASGRRTPSVGRHRRRTADRG